MPDYKHSCAQVLHLRGLIRSDEQPTGLGHRDARDRDLYQPIIERLDALTAEAHRRVGRPAPLQPSH